MLPLPPLLLPLAGTAALVLGVTAGAVAAGAAGAEVVAGAVVGAVVGTGAEVLGAVTGTVWPVSAATGFDEAEPVAAQPPAVPIISAAATAMAEFRRVPCIG